MGRGNIEATSIRSIIQALADVKKELKADGFSIDQKKSLKMEINMLYRKIQDFRWLNGQENKNRG